MIFADRVGQNFIDPLVVTELEPKVGRACLDAIISFPIAVEVSKLFPLSLARVDQLIDPHPSLVAAPGRGLGVGSLDRRGVGGLCERVRVGCSNLDQGVLDVQKSFPGGLSLRIEGEGAFDVRRDFPRSLSPCSLLLVYFDRLRCTQEHDQLRIAISAL
jgi:hypothetical protein